MRSIPSKDHDKYLADLGILLADRVATSLSERDIKATNNFATYIRAVREQRGLSQEEVAQQTGQSEFELRCLENGMVLNSQVDYVLLRKLATALNQDVDLLALMLERDIAGAGAKRRVRSEPFKRVWRNIFGQWLHTVSTAPILSLRMSAALATIVLCLVLLSPGNNALFPDSIDSTRPSSQRVETVGGTPAEAISNHKTVRREHLQIVYTHSNHSNPENLAYFAVDHQRVAMVSYIGKRIRPSLLE